MALPDPGRQHDPEVWELLAWRHDSRTYLYLGADRGLVRAGNHGQTFAGVKNAGSAHTLNVVSGTVLTSLTSGVGGYDALVSPRIHFCLPLDAPCSGQPETDGAYCLSDSPKILAGIRRVQSE